MPITFDQSKDQIATLVKQFRTNFSLYHAAGYKEAHARQDFIDPMFIALDWDVHNTQHATPLYRQVVIEDSLDIEGKTKAPDYAFRIGRDPVFFVEAKRPGILLKTADDAAFQVRRYAWSAKLPLSILTDFEEFGIYDCRSRPSEKDRAGVARVNYYTFEEYADRWHEIWDIFSHEAVLTGSFNQYAESTKGKRGTTPVDAEFLREIEQWRESLAHNFALRNPNLSTDELNDAVQRTIDRLIFLRMAEDRGIEPYERLKGLANQSDNYAGLISLSRKADAKYNSGLFDLSPKGDRLTARLALDDKTLKPIILDLYYPNPYEFKYMPVEILGDVYEQFLGKVIRLTPSHQAKVEEKPEVKKAGGVKYTPSYIVKYIVKTTIGKWIEEHVKPHDRVPLPLTFRVLDMSCGSGSFALGAYQYLLDYYLQWYIDHDPKKYPKAVHQINGEWRLTIAEKKRILTAHIFGVDIDRQAVEVTKLSLLLKVLEGENDETLQMRLFDDESAERALPNLDQNIKCGNSLIGPDFFADKLMSDSDEMRRVNPFDWQKEFPEIMRAGGFDVIIGNPPYIRMETFKEIKDYLKANYACHDERSDLYAYMIEKSQKLLGKSGRFGMIVSNKFLRANYGKPLRDFLQQHATIESIVDFAGLPVFKGATVRTIVLIATRNKSHDYTIAYTPPLPVDKFNAVTIGAQTVEEAIAEFTYEVSSNALEQQVWSFAESGADELLERLKLSHMPLKQYCEGQICRGVVSGLTEAFVIGENTQVAIQKRNSRAGEIIKPFLNGRDVRRYHIDYKGLYLIYTYHGIDIDRYPAIEQHLTPFKSKLQSRATRQAWYELQQPQRNFAQYMDGPKIIFPDIATTPRFALDEVGYYSSNTTYFIPQRDLYLLGLLNSSFGNFYFVKTCAGLEGKTETYLRFFGQYLEGFPVRPIDLSDPADKAAHDRVVKLVDTMLQLHPRLATAKSAADRDLIQRQIDATDRQIDALVYQLYGLSEEEINIVEGNG